MKIAIITGASSGIGPEYVRAATEQFPDVQTIWVIARRQDRLQALVEQFPTVQIVPMAMDLCDKASFDTFAERLKAEQPDVRLLINNAGFGKLGDFEEIGVSSQADMVDLNDRAPVMMTALTLPYMGRGAVILNTCSIASYVPTPRMAVYCSTKAFILSFSKALRHELKKRGINVHAACPGPMETEFLAVADIPKGKSKLFDFCPRVDARKMADKSLKAARRGRAVYTNRLIYKLYRVLCKLVPHNWIMGQTTA